MRTKTFLLTAAVLAAGLSASVAQSVFSVNAVGYVNLTLGPGFSLISNPLNGTNNLLSTILPTPPGDTYILKWNPASQTFTDPFNYLEGVGWLPDTTVAPGEGVFINLPAGPSVTLTFVGEVPQGSLPNQISANFSLLASVVPQQLALDSPQASFPVQGDDYVLFWNYAGQRFDDPINYLDGVGWLPAAPAPAVGQAFFFFTGAGARSWVRTFSVN